MCLDMDKLVSAAEVKDLVKCLFKVKVSWLNIICYLEVKTI